jgi:hypothetical protein
MLFIAGMATPCKIIDIGKVIKPKDKNKSPYIRLWL